MKSLVAQGHKRATVNSTGSGFDLRTRSQVSCACSAMCGMQRESKKMSAIIKLTNLSG